MKSWSPQSGSLDITTLCGLYETQQLTPSGLVEVLGARLQHPAIQQVFIQRVSPEQLQAQAQRLESQFRERAKFPLWGLPFVVKDNIDIAGLPTTAACPGFSYTPAQSAPIVEKLLAAGAMLVGKTNMDQFATGLTGVLSPYGVCRNPFDERYIAGGSSSGSAVAVAGGVASFALGTDTAGSGRVPAGFCNIIGLKPTRGLVSTRGLVPACRSLDCPSIFALTAPDAAAVLEIMKGYDSADPYSQPQAATLDLGVLPLPLKSFRFGVPRRQDLDFTGGRGSGVDDEAQEAYWQAVTRLQKLGGRPVEIDFSVFAETAKLLYEGPWLAERAAGLANFLSGHAAELLPVTRTLLQGAAAISGLETFQGWDRLQKLRRQVEAQWALMDTLLLPTTPTIFTVAEAEANPVACSGILGRYTNFVNLLDTCAIALPAGIRASNGLPIGVTLIAPAWQEARLIHLATRHQIALGGNLGKTSTPAHAVLSHEEIWTTDPKSTPAHRGFKLAVVGAHLSGLPLNYQLTELNATLVMRCRTAPGYRLYALSGLVPPKPGLVRERSGEGHAIEVEVWELPLEHVGTFVNQVAAPLCIGTLTLENGEQVHGFLCENQAVENALEISRYGGWRNYLAHKLQPKLAASA